MNPRTGATIAPIGGRTPLNTSELTPARVAGDVFAFNDWGTPGIVYQDVRTGRVVRRLAGPDCGGAACANTPMIHAGTGIALLSMGNVVLLDGAGKVTARGQLPVCTGP
jgi:hypothetical protein